MAQIYFGVSLNEYIDRSGTGEGNRILKFFQNTTKMYPYLISIGSSKSITSKRTSHENCCINVNVALPSNTNAYTQTQAYFHANLYRRIIHDALDLNLTTDDDSFRQMVDEKVQEALPMAWETFVSECAKAGWDLSRTELHSGGYEIAVKAS
jgi:hypothetical protein